MNVSAPLEGPDQTNQRAELMAAVAALRTENRPCEIKTDSKYVCDGCTCMLSCQLGLIATMKSHLDLWLEMEGLLRARPPNT
eukprot:2447060-Karenia_brevis.AAC.1